MFNRRTLLAALGLTFPALAAADAAVTRKKVVKPRTHRHPAKPATHKTHKTPKPAVPAQS